MNNSLKGALWSGLIFPGLGQLVLKHYKRGTGIMLTVLVSLAVVAVKAVQPAIVILEKIESQGGAITISTITNAATKASTTSGSLTLKFVLLLIFLCWVIGIVDAYLIGKKMDSDEDSTRGILNEADD